MSAPGWQTSELDEEWPDSSFRSSDSPASSSSSPNEQHTHRSGKSQSQLDSLGRPTSTKSQPQKTPFRVVSGHTHNSQGSLLGRPTIGRTPEDGEREKKRLAGEFAEGVWSPPSSAGGSLKQSGRAEAEGEEEASSSSSSSEQDGSRRQLGTTTSTRPAGTFLVKPVDDDDETGPPKQLRNPFVQKGGLFGPLALESMFQPPPPPPVGMAMTGGTSQQMEELGATGGSRSTSGFRSALEEETGSQNGESSGVSNGSRTKRSTSPTGPPPALHQTTSPAASSSSPASSSSSSSVKHESDRSPSDGQASQGPLRKSLRRTSHGYVPVRPSRLSESISPESSMGGSVRSGHGREYRSETGVEGSFEREAEEREYGDEEGIEEQDDGEEMVQQRKSGMKRFSGAEDSMRDVSFTFSPRLSPPAGGNTSRGAGNGSMSTPIPTGKGSLKLFRLRDSVAVYPVNDEKGLETPLVSAGRKKREEAIRRVLVERSRSLSLEASPARQEQDDVEDEQDVREEGSVTDEEMRERKPKRIRLDSPSVDSASPGSSSILSERRGSPRYADSPRFSSGRRQRSASSTPSYASDPSPSSFNDTRRLQFHIGLSSPQTRSGANAAGNRQSWEQRGVEMLQHIRSRLLVDGNNGNRSVGQSPSTITNSGSEQSPESSGRREELASFEGTVRERSESPFEGSAAARSFDVEGVSPLVERHPAARVLAHDLPATRASSGNTAVTAIYVGPDRTASQATSNATVRAPMGPNGTVNSQSSGSSSGGTITTSGSGSTVTEKYLSAGMGIMDRIRERKFSESSGTMTGPEHEGDARSASSAGRPSSSQSQNRQEVEVYDERDDSATDLRRSRMASLRAPPASQHRQVRSVASSSSLSASSKGSGRPSSLPLDRPASLAPLPSTTEDMNRFISATTVTTHRTTNTAVSTSFVKHRGPPSRPRGLQSMGPQDIPQMPSQVGKMVFDPQQLKWVRASGVRGASGIGTVSEEGESSEGSSIDVFAGLESLRDDRAGSQRFSMGASLRRSQEAQQCDVENDLPEESGAVQEEWVTREEETRQEAARQEAFSNRVDPDQEDCVSLDDVEVEIDEHSVRRSLSVSQVRENTPGERDGEASDNSLELPDREHEEVRPQLVQTQSAPTPLQASDSTPLRSALRAPGATPASALKRNSTLWDSPVNEITDSATKRNVSFSDGKRPGKINNKHTTLSRDQMSDHSDKSVRSGVQNRKDDVFQSVSPGAAPTTQPQPLPSARSKRIHDLLEDIEGESMGQPTPTRMSHGAIVALSESPETSGGPSGVDESDSDSGRVFMTSRRESRNKGDATFLTECSFAVSHDKLVELITEVQPFEPYWEDLTAIDLSKRGATSVARLKEFLPKLDEVNLNDNEISYLSGIPATVRTLFAAGNKISSLTAINHLNNIQYLDLSRNDLDGVNALSCLRHLREIKLDDNRITDLGNLLKTDSLVKLSCSGNRISELDLRAAKWPHLETLDLSGNVVEGVYALERLSSLVTLNLESNNLTELVVAEPMTSLRVLRLSNNDIADFDLSSYPRLRTLYADNNSLSGLGRSQLRSASRLENLSLRNQRGRALRLSFDDLRDVKRLYVSGNPLPADFFPTRALYSMAYLEVAACKLSSWPEDFARRLPNLRHLNLNYNFIEDLSGLRGMQGLRKLSVIGGRLGSTSTREVVADLRGLGTLESVDLRMNPCTLNFYLPIIVTDTAAFCALRAQGHQDTPGSPSWVSMDVNFRRSLPDEWYSKRLIYRGLVAMACEGIQTIDGLHMTNAERSKARQLVESALEDAL